MEVSVVIPIHNGLCYLEKCLSSVIKQNVDMEIIIIDDASTDGLEKELENIKKKLNIETIIYLKNEIKLGPAATRNKGIIAASGHYIAFIDADDWWEEGKLKEQLKVMEEKETYFVFTGRRNVFEDGRTNVVECMEKITYNDILKNNHITTSSVLIDSNIAKRYLMEHSELCEDYLTWLKILKDYKNAYGINKPLVNYRVHKNSTSSNKIRHAIKRYKVYKLIGINFPMRIYYSMYYMIVGISKYYVRKKGN